MDRGFVAVRVRAAPARSSEQAGPLGLGSLACSVHGMLGGHTHATCLSAPNVPPPSVTHAKELRDFIRTESVSTISLDGTQPPLLSVHTVLDLERAPPVHERAHHMEPA